jgi:uracil phosphoribosyltransferase
LPTRTPSRDREHRYGDNVHILADPFLLTHLAFLCSEGSQPPAIKQAVRDLYQSLMKAVMNGEMPRVTKPAPTRMAASSPYGTWTGEILDPDTRAVSVNIMRAGTLPSQVCHDTLNKTLTPKLVRQDHVGMSRMTNENGQAIGSTFGDSKIGGDVDAAFVLLSAPMGATGGSLAQAISHYKHASISVRRRPDSLLPATEQVCSGPSWPAASHSAGRQRAVARRPQQAHRHREDGWPGHTQLLRSAVEALAQGHVGWSGILDAQGMPGGIRRRVEQGALRTSDVEQTVVAVVAPQLDDGGLDDIIPPLPEDVARWRRFALTQRMHRDPHRCSRRERSTKDADDPLYQ